MIVDFSSQSLLRCLGDFIGRVWRLSSSPSDIAPVNQELILTIESLLLVFSSTGEEILGLLYGVLVGGDTPAS